MEPTIDQMLAQATHLISQSSLLEEKDGAFLDPGLSRDQLLLANAIINLVGVRLVHEQRAEPIGYLLTDKAEEALADGWDDQVEALRAATYDNPTAKTVEQMPVDHAKDALDALRASGWDLTRRDL